jgi:threonine dehydrogenase-like Zn-dependent dehydrogenase
MSGSIAAVVAVAPGRSELRTLERPALDHGAGWMRVEATGVCGSDWPYYQRLPGLLGPLILGHEMVGVVTDLGREARARWPVKEGDRVVLEEYLPCRQCAYCLSGDFRLCEATEIGPQGLRYGSTALATGPGLWGGYAQHLYLHPSTVFHRLPAHVPARLATLALPLGNGIEWVIRQGGTRPGDTVVIQGPGQQGLACVVAAREAGASCIVMIGLGTRQDRRRLEVARLLGAHHVLEADTGDVVAGVAALTHGAMADLVVDCASGGGASVQAALRLARKRGRVLLAAPKGQRLPDFDTDLMIARYLTVRGMRGHGYDSVERAIDLIASGRHPLEAMTTHVLGLAEVDLALRTIGGHGMTDAIHMSVDPWRAGAASEASA